MAEHPIPVAMFVSPMGHDVNRVSALVCRWLEQSGIFRVTLAGDCPGAKCSIGEFMDDGGAVDRTGLFFFLCYDEPWGNPAHRRRLERAVASGSGALFFHGLQPGFRDWPELEKMIGLLWRKEASHGDFDFYDVCMAQDHPVTHGLLGFRTKEEVYCGLTNVWDVPQQVLVSTRSPAERISRHGQPGTGREEPLLTVGRYGQGRTVNFLLGHVWPHYTGHGLLENTLISFEPPEVKALLLRSCEWAANGAAAATV